MSEILEKEKVTLKVKPPKMWQVVFLNDDFTPFEFVMIILMTIFNKNQEQAWQITQKVHQEGKSVVGQYPYDIAQTKQQKAIDLARENEFPLQIELQQM